MSLKVLKNAWFRRFARKQRISDAALLDAIRRAERGLVDADLGGGVIKQRLARSGQGKSGGYRTIVLFRRETLAVFVFGFAKNDKANLEPEELEQFKAAASHVLSLNEKQIMQLIERGQFTEIKGNDEKLQE